MGGGLFFYLAGKLFTDDSSQTSNQLNSDVSRQTNTNPDFSTSPPSPVTKISTKSNLLIQNFDFETVTVDAKGAITNRRKLNAKYVAEDLGNGVTLEMVQIPGGTFTMGSPAGETQRSNDEGPQHEVTVPGFYMGRYEVTQAQYEAIMGKNPARFQGEKLKGSNRPVESVSWNDAKEFCKKLKLSEKTGRDYRLPSESEWEYACRAGTTTPFYFGKTITPDLVNYNGNIPYGDAPKGKYREQTTDVGSFPPNAFGLYDMHGNVWEWCEDTWHNNYKDAPTDGSAWIDNGNRYRRLLRGGSWKNISRNCRCAARFMGDSGFRNGIDGFRVVLSSA